MKVGMIWEYCSTCDCYMFVCPKCGNNCCNGMYGLDGKCDVCPVVYKLQDTTPYPHHLPHATLV